MVETGRGAWGRGHSQGAQVSVGRRGQSAAAEFELGKLMLKKHSVRDIVHACTDLEYINPTPSSVAAGSPPHDK